MDMNVDVDPDWGASTAASDRGRWAAGIRRDSRRAVSKQPDWLRFPMTGLEADRVCRCCRARGSPEAPQGEGERRLSVLVWQR